MPQDKKRLIFISLWYGYFPGAKLSFVLWSWCRWEKMLWHFYRGLQNRKWKRGSWYVCFYIMISSDSVHWMTLNAGLISNFMCLYCRWVLNGYSYCHWLYFKLVTTGAWGGQFSSPASWSLMSSTSFPSGFSLAFLFLEIRNNCLIRWSRFLLLFWKWSDLKNLFFPKLWRNKLLHIPDTLFFVRDFFLGAIFSLLNYHFS